MSVCEHCKVEMFEHDYEQMARECYPKQIRRLEVALADARGENDELFKCALTIKQDSDAIIRVLRATPRHFLSLDNDGHWMIVPVNMREAWDVWRNTSWDDDEGDDWPEYVTPVGGSPGRVTFTNPEIAP